MVSWGKHALILTVSHLITILNTYIIFMLAVEQLYICSFYLHRIMKMLTCEQQE